MKLYNLSLGAFISLFLTLSVLPVRLSEGQGAKPVNLIGSEIMIGIMCLSMWILANNIYHHIRAHTWQKIALCILICAVLSNVFYYLSNPLFEDYPVRPMKTLPLWLATVRLSLRGILIGSILIPAVFLFENERRIQKAKLDKEQRRADQAESQQSLLEELIKQRTHALEQALSTLHASRDELDNQVYVLSRVVASITHDVKAPLKYIIIIAKRINKLLTQKEYAVINEHTVELTRSLEGISLMMNNLLEFTTGQLRKESIHQSQVNLAVLVEDKLEIFEGIARAQENLVETYVDTNSNVLTNLNLVSIIVHNLLDNATKYTKKGLIKVSIDNVGRELRLTVENTSEAFQSDFSIQDVHSNDNILRSTNNGIGLLLVTEIAALLDLQVSIKSSKFGVVADVIFPMRKVIAKNA